ncbi:FAD-dependent monooxygenase [Mitsuaria sp. WAJ17]|uniref:FAD-dependent monooxygenase n=1 Tax=Mitsuaria sp. WAJ17 TaxID=2761452 RepID=UPI0016003A28|nr:FAD-dependent monooxygenase [Mitsuaria sp. WAJ17]MBB2484706.1 FAD-dependent monooxygenase [Mitsuaria sp. WAJ17]
MRTDAPAAPPSPAAPLRIAVVGAGPAGLGLALLAARRLPEAQIQLFDARPLDKDISGDPRTLALSLGSVQLLQRLQAWNEAAAQSILQVQVSQAPPTLRHPVFGEAGQPVVSIQAREQGEERLGAVLAYGQLVAPMQAAWLRHCESRPAQAMARFGQPVAGIRAVGDEMEVDAGIADRFDLVVIAEGGVFAEQSRKSLSHDYQQNAWVGTVTLDPASPPGVAYERFTRNGPLALLPLPPTPQQPHRAALVWCLPQAEDEVAGLTDAQRLTVINQQLPPGLPPLRGISPLKCFPLGLNAERSLVEGRLVRIGNAAQTLHPVAGQGLNLGLRDAYALVEALVHAQARQPGSPLAAAVAQALQRVQWQRGPDRWSTILGTDFLARSFSWRWPALPALRGLGLAALQALPPVKKALARQMMFGRR